MKTWKVVLMCVCLVGLAHPVWSQKANDAAKPDGILGYLDPKTGAFRPLVQRPVEEEEAPALAPTTGTLVFNFTISIKSTNLGSDTIACTANASTNELANGFLASESASVKATVRGSTATCKVTIPYSWPLKTPAIDTVSLDYTVGAVGAGTATVLGLPNRDSLQSLPSIKVPLTGATTTETINSTI
jgi:hypothetical protein